MNAARPILITGGHPLSASLKALAVLAVLWLILWAAERLLLTTTHTPPLPPPDPIVEHWGPRPHVMTRCVECGVNEWPACRCTLARREDRPSS